MLTEVHGKHSYKIFFYLEIVNFAICHSLLLQAIPTFYWKFLEWFHFQINTQGGDRLLDSTVHINHYLKRVRLRLFIYMSMNQTAYLNNFCSLQQSSLLPSGPHSQTLSTCGAYHHPEHQGSGYRFQAWCSSSWNQQRTSYTIWGEKHLLKRHWSLYCLYCLFKIQSRIVDLLTRILHLLQSVDAIFLFLP